MVPGSIYGALAQLVVRYIRIVEVRGSTPLCSTKQTTLLGNVIQIRMTERELELK